MVGNKGADLQEKASLLMGAYRSMKWLNTAPAYICELLLVSVFTDHPHCNRPGLCK